MCNNNIHIFNLCPKGHETIIIRFILLHLKRQILLTPEKKDVKILIFNCAVCIVNQPTSCKPTKCNKAYSWKPVCHTAAPCSMRKPIHNTVVLGWFPTIIHAENIIYWWCTNRFSQFFWKDDIVNLQFCRLGKICISTYLRFFLFVKHIYLRAFKILPIYFCMVIVRFNISSW
jgi:hypothetical protein